MLIPKKIKKRGKTIKKTRRTPVVKLSLKRTRRIAEPKIQLETLGGEDLEMGANAADVEADIAAHNIGCAYQAKMKKLKQVRHLKKTNSTIQEKKKKMPESEPKQAQLEEEEKQQRQLQRTRCEDYTQTFT